MRILAGTLRRGLMLIEPVISKRHAIEVLKNSVLLKDGKVMGTDLQVYVSIDLDEEMEGSFILLFKEVLGMLKYIPASEIVTIERVGKSEVIVKWQGGQSKYPYHDPDDYPPMPEAATISELSVDGDLFVGALDSVVGYCADEESRPVLTGVCINEVGDSTDVAAADGYRLAMQTIQQRWFFEKQTIIPSKTVSILYHLWKHGRPSPVVAGTTLVEAITAKPQLNIALVQRKGVIGEDLEFNFDGISVRTLLIDDRFPNYKQVIPKEFNSTVTLFAVDLNRSLRQLKHTASGNGAVWLSWTEDMMTATASNEEIGTTERSVPAKADKPGKIAFNIDFLLDYLKSKEGVITMSVVDEKSPAAFRYQSSPLVVIMPLFVQW